MYPHFIEVHDPKGQPALFNIDHIVCLCNGQINASNQDDDTGWVVAESYTELKELIRSAGCAIRKADPRLDDRVPLGMEELCSLEMVGQPVWNSNTREWMLVIDSDHMHNTIDLIDNCGKIVQYGPHEVKKFPLYRMKNA